MTFEWQPELDTLDIVPEKFRGLYAQGEAKEGETAKFLLDGDVAKRMDTSTLANTLKKERDNAKTLKTLVAAFEKVAKTPDEAEKLVGDLRGQLAEALKAKDSAGAAAWEKQRTDLETTHTKALEAKDTELSGMRKALHAHMVNSQLTAELSALGASPVDVLLAWAAPNVRVVEEAGEFLVRVVDAQGEPRESKPGSPMTIREYVAELKKDPRFARLFVPSGTSGGGMPPGGSPGGIPGGGPLTPLQRLSKGLSERK
ncbi:hypothetical protein QEG98_28330 [Myxococcus sp. MxC21-1]|uniref:hypothetical protein n=1 Tax=Myxococcus sp. MxC21-1 TaxID=3041439 RepID=UPI00292D0040|nr:hypothetical protein [Myxococcus sp. MxC21-1]WNZ59914.1 hypothetical protein QEG98_28330 [Myxococcus sp. MxC21-1]